MIPAVSYDLHGLIETMESDPAVSMTMLNPLQQSHTDYRIFYKNGHVRSRGLYETAEPDPSVSLDHRKPIPRSDWNNWKQSYGLIETVESWNLNFSNDNLEYLGEYEAICESGP
jgi:hypothetical protein